MKLFFTGIFTETNTFAPLPAGESCWSAGSDGLIDTDELLARAGRAAWEVESGPLFVAQPSGITPRSLYERMRDEILDALDETLPVDAVQLFLHGAMVADGYDDCEGDLLEHIRKLVGPGVPVGAELDLHAHLSAAMLENASLLVGFKEYPHTDMQEQMLRLFELLIGAASGEICPVSATFDCRMLGFFPTTAEPMRSFVDALRLAELRDGALDAWLCHGFPYGDVPFAGAKLMVTTDGDRKLAQTLCESLGRELYVLRDRLRPRIDSIADCLDRAATAHGPVTIADTADNPGGGAPGDATFFLEEILARKLAGCALGPLWDPISVNVCFDAGAGARLPLRIGGKSGPSSGRPLDVQATVVAVNENLVQSLGETYSFSLGRCAAIRIAIDESPPVHVVLAENRGQAFTPALFSDLGIDPTACRILVVKSTQHFHAAFTSISTAVMYAGDRGALQADVLEIPYERLDTTALWPFCSDPLANG